MLGGSGLLNLRVLGLCRIGCMDDGVLTEGRVLSVVHTNTSFSWTKDMRWTMTPWVHSEKHHPQLRSTSKFFYGDENGVKSPY